MHPHIANLPSLFLYGPELWDDRPDLGELPSQLVGKHLRVGCFMPGRIVVLEDHPKNKASLPQEFQVVFRRRLRKFRHLLNLRPRCRTETKAGQVDLDLVHAQTAFP